MELLCYFRPLSEKEELDPNGPLLRHVPPTVITSVNEELQNKRSAPKSRGEYMKINQEEKAKVAKYASEMELPKQRGILKT